jgi:hypothetical protein
MQGTADFHPHVARPLLPHPDGLCEHAAAFDTALDMCKTPPSPRDLSIARFLLRRQCLPARLLRRRDEVHALQRARWKAQVLQQMTPRGQRIRRGVSQAFVVDASRLGLTQQEEAQRGVDQEEVLHPMPLLLAAIAHLLCRGSVGAREGTLGAVMTKRGTVVGAAARVASDSEAASDRGGPSPGECSPLG